MKFVHLSDLHIGKRVNGFSQLEDQEYILTQILGIINKSKVEAVVIAGDVYDKSVPTAEAVTLFNSFLSSLANRGLKVFIISGNHDSAERLSFGSEIMNKSGIYIAPVYNGKVNPVTLNDEYGELNFYLLPFIKPANVKRFFENTEIESYNSAVKTVIDDMAIDLLKRNVLVTHQFVTGAVRSESEEITVGGTDNIDCSNFDNFDYVALGHIHAPQNVGRSTVRYCGTPLKYSFSEINHNKSVTIVTMNEKGNISVELLPLIPKRDLREIKGNYLTVSSKEFYKNLNTDDYYHVTLTNDEDVIDAIAKLRVIYPNIMKLDYDNKRTRQQNNFSIDDNTPEKTPLQMFSEFFELQNNNCMSDEQISFLSNLINSKEEF